MSAPQFGVNCIDLLPTPLAQSVARLQAARSAGQGLAVLFFMRDAVESLLKLVTAVGLADLFRSALDDPDRLREISREPLDLVLAKLPATGDWVCLARLLGQHGDPALLGGAIAALVKSREWKTLFEGERDYVAFRNETIGHGAYRPESEYLQEADRFLEPLAQLIGETGTRFWNPGFIRAAGIDWKGLRPQVVPEQGSSPPWQPAYLIREGIPDVLLDPLVRAHFDPQQKEWDLLLFNHMKWRKNPETARAHFLDYVRGQHRIERPFRAVVERFFSFDSSRYGPASVVDAPETRAAELPPETLVSVPYLSRRLAEWGNQALGDEAGGAYARLIGPAGSGKSCFMRSVMEFKLGPDSPEYLRRSLVHSPRCHRFFHSIALHGATPERFWSRLSLQARQQKLLIQDERTASACRDLGKWIRQLQRLNQPRLFQESIFIGIDGLDEIPDQGGRDQRLTAWLTPLPARVCVLLGSRPELRKRAAADTALLEERERGRLEKITLDPGSSDNLEIQRWFLEQQVEGLAVEQAGQVLQASGGIFLYTQQFAHALKLDVVHQGEPLPEKAGLVRILLHDLRRRAGEEIFRQVHLRLLAALIAACAPLRAAALADYWGLPQDRLDAALADLGFAVRMERGETAENQFTLSHLLVRETMLQEAGVREAVAQAHREYSLRVCEERRAFTPDQSLWSGEDAAADPDAAYALLHVVHHLGQAGLAHEAEQVGSDPSYRMALIRTAQLLVTSSRYSLAEQFWQHALAVPVQDGDPRSLAMHLDSLLGYAGHLAKISRHQEASRFALKAAAMAESAGDGLRQGIALSIAGYAACHEDRYSRAAEMLDRGKTILAGVDASRHHLAVNEIWRTENLYLQNQLPESLELCNALLEEKACRERPDLLARVEHLRGRVYIDQGDFTNARASLEFAMKRFIELGMETELTDIRSFISEVYLKLGVETSQPDLIDKAMEMAQQALAEYLQFPDYLGCSEACWAIGDVHFERGQLEEARHWYREELRYANLAESASIFPYKHLAQLFLRIGEPDQARNMVAQAERIVKKSERKDFQEEFRDIMAALYGDGTARGD